MKKQNEPKRPQNNRPELVYPSNFTIEVGPHRAHILRVVSGYACVTPDWLQGQSMETPGTVIDALFAAYAMSKGVGSVDHPLDVSREYPDLVRMEMGRFVVHIYKTADGPLLSFPEHKEHCYQSLGQAVDMAFELYAVERTRELNSLEVSDISEAVGHVASRHGNDSNSEEW